MNKVFLVFDEYCYSGFDGDIKVYACATMEIAIRKIKERLEWYFKNSYLNQFVDDNLNLIENKIDEYDVWDIYEDCVEIFIEGKETSLNLHIVETDLINE